MCPIVNFEALVVKPHKQDEYLAGPVAFLERAIKDKFTLLEKELEASSYVAGLLQVHKWALVPVT